MEIYFFMAAALLYVGCALLPSHYRFPIAVGTAAAWLLQGIALWQGVATAPVWRFGFALMLSVTLWISVAAYWWENRHGALEGLRILVLPCAAVTVVLPMLFPGGLVLLDGQFALFSWHVVISILAYGVLTMAAFHAVLMALQESKLHIRSGFATGWFSTAIDRLPALLTMEKLLFRLIGLGFLLLTFTVLSGVIFSEQVFGAAIKWNHKTVFTMLSWVLFGALLAGHKWRGWRGKTALRLTLAGFATLLLAYVGSRFVLEVILHRGLL